MFVFRAIGLDEFWSIAAPGSSEDLSCEFLVVVILARPERLTISIELFMFGGRKPPVVVLVLPRRLICLPTELELFIVELAEVLTMVVPRLLPRRFLPLYCEVSEVFELCLMISLGPFRLAVPEVRAK